MNGSFDGIKLIGCSGFIEKTSAALQLLKATTTYEHIVRPNLGTIQHIPRRWFHIVRKTNFAEAPWRGDQRLVQVFADITQTELKQFAAVLAHEAFHHFIYFEHLRFGNQNSWNWHRWFRRHRDEIRCRKFEIAVAKELEVDQDYLDYLESFLFVIPHWDLPRKQLAILDHLRRRLKVDRNS